MLEEIQVQAAMVHLYILEVEMVVALRLEEVALEALPHQALGLLAMLLQIMEVVEVGLPDKDQLEHLLAALVLVEL
jgi:hypothetical protein